jgi:hypothetical protein
MLVFSNEHFQLVFKMKTTSLNIRALVYFLSGNRDPLLLWTEISWQVAGSCLRLI